MCLTGGCSCENNQSIPDKTSANILYPAPLPPHPHPRYNYNYSFCPAASLPPLYPMECTHTHTHTESQRFVYDTGNVRQGKNEYLKTKEKEELTGNYI